MQILFHAIIGLFTIVGGLAGAVAATHVATSLPEPLWVVLTAVGVFFGMPVGYGVGVLASFVLRVGLIALDDARSR
ncbi:hypothetical protein [Salinarimonas rosea]|uniref:hypothetical protein n=1 Tax=Salinarimonas rosea TaxID=552063 RepID=UPI000427EFEB|nr:hypothetical protein [Salinarimonas rosea]